MSTELWATVGAIAVILTLAWFNERRITRLRRLRETRRDAQ